MPYCDTCHAVDILTPGKSTCNRCQKKWFTDADNVVALGEWLVDNHICDTAKRLQWYYEKPWKWTDEWEQMQAGHDPMDCECKCSICANP